MVAGRANPKVSICVPTYNGAAYLRECLETALDQTFSDIEILVVDDGSTDDTVSIAEAYAEANKTVRICVNKQNLGLVGNWNRCVELSRGEWIKFLFQDDLLEKHCIASMLDAVRPEIDLITCTRRFLFENGTPNSVKNLYMSQLSEHSLCQRFSKRSFVTPKELADLMARIPHYNCIGEPTMTLIRRTAFERFGYFMADFVSFCDWEYFARIGVNRGIGVVDAPLATFRVHETAESARLRMHRNYRGDLIDKVIISYHLVYSPYFAPVRFAARASENPVSLKQQLLWAMLDARREAYLLSSDPVNPDPQPLSQWKQLLSRYPRLRYLPLSYGLDRTFFWITEALTGALGRRARF